MANVVETYVGLRRRVTGLPVTRKEFTDASESFPSLLELLEKHTPQHIESINLGEVEWYHRLRNELYHQGNGLTVERAKVDAYAELSKLLFRNFFGFDVQPNISEGES